MTLHLPSEHSKTCFGYIIDAHMHLALGGVYS